MKTVPVGVPEEKKSQRQMEREGMEAYTKKIESDIERRRIEQERMLGELPF